jgi:hypothetical protein
MIARSRERRRDWRTRQVTSQVLDMRHRDCVGEWIREDKGGRHRQPHRLHTLVLLCCRAAVLLYRRSSSSNGQGESLCKSQLIPRGNRPDCRDE